MTYPKIQRRRNSLKISGGKGRSPMIELSSKDGHLEWARKLKKEAEENAKKTDHPRMEADRLRAFWGSVAAFMEKLESGAILQVWNFRGEMSKRRGFSDEAFTAASKALFGVS